MNKKFFTKVSPKAAGGIKKVYEQEGYEVRAKVSADGSLTVVAVKGDDRPPSGLLARAKGARSADKAAA
jgi:hypothetical protein